MSTPQPWDAERRNIVKRRIDKEAARAAGRLGAETVMIIAFFRDGEYAHMLDGGTAPMPPAELYARLLSVKQVLAESGGKDVAVS